MRAASSAESMKSTWALLVFAGLCGAGAGAAEPPSESPLARLGSPRLRHAYAVVALAFTADGKAVAAAGVDGNVLVWDAATGDERLRFGGPP